MSAVELWLGWLWGAEWSWFVGGYRRLQAAGNQPTKETSQLPSSTAQSNQPTKKKWKQTTRQIKLKNGMNQFGLVKLIVGISLACVGWWMSWCAALPSIAPQLWPLHRRSGSLLRSPFFSLSWRGCFLLSFNKWKEERQAAERKEMELSHTPATTMKGREPNPFPFICLVAS